MSRIREAFFPPVANIPLKFANYTAIRSCTSNFSKVKVEAKSVLDQREMDKLVAGNEKMLYIFPDGAAETSLSRKTTRFKPGRNWLSKPIRHAAGGGYVI